MPKSNLQHLTLEEKDQLKEYVASLKEIKKAIQKLVRGGSKKVEETGGNQSTGKILNLK